MGAPPHGAGGVDLLGGAGLDGLLLLGVPLALVVGEEDGEGDVVGVLLDDLLQAPAIGVLRALVVEVDEDGGSGALARIGAGDLFDVEAGLAVAGPLICLVFAGLARDDLNLVGDHEDGVEADAELADEVGVLAGVAGELGRGSSWCRSGRWCRGARRGLPRSCRCRCRRW